MDAIITLPRKVSVLMPAYNEASCIVPSVQETIRTMDGFGAAYEIIVIDDGSHDGTFDKIRALSAAHGRVIAVKNRENFGKGRALKKGFRHVTGDYVVFLDCDLDLHPSQVKNLFEVMRREDVDVVIGSKRHPQSQVIYPWTRKMMSTVYFFLVKVLFGLPIRDTQTGLKLFRREVLQRVFQKMLVKRYAFDLEILALAHHFKYRIAQAPVTLRPQRPRHRVKFSDVVNTLWDTLAIFYRMHILRWYDRPHGRAAISHGASARQGAL